MRRLIGKLPVKFVLAVPAPLAPTAFTVSAPPAGATESFWRVRVTVVVFPRASAPVTASVGWLEAPSLQSNEFESYGPPGGVETVLGECDHPAVVPPSADVVLDAGPVPASVSAFLSLKVPPEPSPVPR